MSAAAEWCEGCGERAEPGHGCDECPACGGLAAFWSTDEHGESETVACARCHGFGCVSRHPAQRELPLAPPSSPDYLADDVSF